MLKFLKELQLKQPDFTLLINPKIYISLENKFFFFFYFSYGRVALRLLVIKYNI